MYHCCLFRWFLVLLLSQQFYHENYFLHRSLGLRIFLGQALRSQLIGPMDYTFNILKANDKLPSEKTIPTHALTKNTGRYTIFLTLCQYLIIFTKKIFPQSDRHKMASIVLICSSLITSEAKDLFMFIGHSLFLL